ncbi:MAG TPA: iron-containing alcohol dehydrogenase, partial [Candidatus Dormibacteraeota bacterium]
GGLSEHYVVVELRAGAAASLPIAGRPDRPALAELEAAAAAAGARSIVAVGAGVVLDLAKLAGARAGTGVVLVPAGAEPWRAVTTFATVDNGDGTRTSTPDSRLGGARIVVDAGLWAAVPAEAAALHRLDSAIHAIESLLSRRSQPYSQALATGALTALGDPEQPVRGVVGSFLAAEAFGSTKLGIAHALASPLGAALGVSHDSLNCILGCQLPRQWPDAPAWLWAGRALGTKASGDGVAAALGRMRAKAGLAGSLREAGIAWSDVDGVVDRALRSSGIPFLPRAVGREELVAFARLCWEGAA